MIAYRTCRSQGISFSPGNAIGDLSDRYEHILMKPGCLDVHNNFHGAILYVYAIPQPGCNPGGFPVNHGADMKLIRVD